MSDQSVMGQPSTRELALVRLKKKRDLSAHALAYVLVNAMLVMIWWASGAAFFWPVFPIFGWGIGLAFNVWDVYAPEPTESRIQEEINRLTRR